MCDIIPRRVKGNIVKHWANIEKTQFSVVWGWRSLKASSFTWSYLTHRLAWASGTCFSGHGQISEVLADSRPLAAAGHLLPLPRTPPSRPRVPSGFPVLATPPRQVAQPL